MATTYEQTDNFALDLYGDNDPADLRDGHNHNMTIIDDNLKTINDNVTTANANSKKANDNLTAFGITDSDTATAKKETIDAASTAANENKDALTAMNADSVETATALKNKIDTTATTLDEKANSADVYAKTETYSQNEINEKLDEKEDKKTQQDTILCIGDSYGNGTGTTDPANKNFFKLIGNALGLNVINMSVSGAGWLLDGSASTDAPFSQQLSTANTQIADKTKIKYVIFAGGRNDVSYHSVSDINMAATNTINSAKTNFPDSKIIVIPMMWDSAAIPENAFAQYAGVVNTLKNIQNVSIINGAWTWLKGERDLIIADGIHPTDAGNIEISAYILKGMRGENTYALKYSNTVTAPSAFKITQKDCRFENGIVSICVRVSKADSTNWNANENFAILPRFCNPTHSVEYYPCIYGDGSVGTVGISASSTDSYTILTNFNAKAYQGEILVNISFGAAV